MATGTGADFTIVSEFFWAGLNERVAQNIAAFNAASNNTIRLSSKLLKGNFAQTTILDLISGLIVRRDITSVADVADLKMEDSNLISVKINRRIGPVGQTLDAWKKLGKTNEDMSRALGQQTGDAQAQDWLNTGLISLKTALESVAAVNFDGTAAATATVNTSNLASGRALLGDAWTNVKVWVMHSVTYAELLIAQLGTEGVALDSVAGVAFTQGIPQTLGLPVLVTDSSALFDLNGSAPDTYDVLGLTTGALNIIQSEQSDMSSRIVDGKANLIYRVQGESAFNIDVKGMQYVEATGANPTDATLGTTSSWAQVVSSMKNGPGVRITFNKGA